MTEQKKWNDLTAFITGSSRGIGKAIALKLAHAGIRVILHGKDRAKLEHTKQEFLQQGLSAQAIQADLSNPSEVISLAQKAISIDHQLDILINNAGIPLKKPFYESTEEEWDRMFAINARAPFLLCRECLPALKKSQHPTIINIASVVGIKGYELQSIYSASKHALMGFTKVLTQEVQPFGIRVHAINPGGVATEMVQTMRPDLDSSGLIQPEEIADIVLFLLSHRGNAMIDDIHIRRANGTPWF